MPEVEERIRATAALLAEPNRVELLTRLAAGPSYPSDLATALGLSAQSVSKHLTRLRSGGLVATHREGRRIRYEVASPEVARLLHDLGHLGPAPTPRNALTVPAPTKEHP